MSRGWPPPSYPRRVGSGAKPKIMDDEVLKLLESYTLDKKQRKKLWHMVAKEEGFFSLYRRTIKKKLCVRGLYKYKLIKKLGLIDI